MYLEHFGLREPPFSLTPDTGFFFAHAGHQEALNVLLVALRSGEGFIKIVGEVGTGKTLLCRLLLSRLGDDTVTAYLPNPSLTPSALRMAVAEELGVSCARNAGQHRVLQLLTARLIELTGAGRRAVLCLDEAQALPEESLEALRLLTNLETEKHKLLQVVLFGQPELDRRLARRGLRQLRQRVTFSYRLRPLDRAGVRGYVDHRVRVAGHLGAPLFTPRAVRVLQRASRGVPRLLNILCHKSLMAAYGNGAARVGRAQARRAVRDTESACNQGLRALVAWRSATLGLAAALTLGLGAALWRGALP